MPRLSVWFVKASLAYLAMGFTLGGLMLANKGVLIFPFLFTLLPAHMEFLLMGWMVQLAMGVVFWIVPRFSGTKPRGNVYLIVLAFWLLNLGIGLVAFQPYGNVEGLTFAGRSMEVISVMCFGIGTWKRIKPHGR